MRRILAASIDASIAAAITAVVWFAFGTQYEVALIVFGLYHATSMLVSRGRSPGRIAAGIQVVSAASYQAPLSTQIWIKAIFRPALVALTLLVVAFTPLRLLSVEVSALLVFMAAIGLDAILLAVNRTRQVLSDHGAKTLVVYSAQPDMAGQAVVQ